MTKGTLYKKRGIWYWEYRDNGKRCYRCLETRSGETAIARRNAILKAESPKKWPTGTDHPLESFSKLVETSYTARGRSSTAAEAIRTVKRFVELCPVKTLSHVTRLHVDAYVAARRKAGVVGKTINKELDLLRASVNRLSPGAANPFSRYGRLREDDSEEVGAVPEDVVARYLAVAKGWVRDQLLFFCYVGGRPSSLVEARVGDVRWQTGIIRVRLWKTSRTLRDRYAEVPIAPEIEPTLRRLCEGKDKEDSLFPYRAKYGLLKSLATLAKNHGLPKITRRSLRHTWATQLAKNGTDMKTLMELGGWKSERMVLRYMNSDLSLKRKAIGAIQYAASPGEPRQPRTASQSPATEDHSSDAL